MKNAGLPGVVSANSQLAQVASQLDKDLFAVEETHGEKANREKENRPGKGGPSGIGDVCEDVAEDVSRDVCRMAVR